MYQLYIYLIYLLLYILKYFYTITGYFEVRLFGSPVISNVARFYKYKVEDYV